MLDNKITVEEINKMIKNNNKIYHEIYKLTTLIIKKYSAMDADGIVDVRKIAKKAGITIKEINLTPNNPIIENEILGYYDRIGYGITIKDNNIVLHSHMSELFKRYVIAYDLANYFISFDANNNNDLEICINSLFPVNDKELIYELFATFLLLPFERILELWEEFISPYNQVDLYDWLKYLAFKLHISDYHVTIMYSHIREFGGILYKEYNQHKEEEWMPKIRKYEKLFKGVKIKNNL
jgi:hypothetical protein